MENEIKKTVKILDIQYALLWLLPLLIVFLFEMDLFPVGGYADNPHMQYTLETIGILLIIACVPLSLKLFSFVLKKKIDNFSFPVALKMYKFWSGIRLLMLGVPVLLNIVIYYLTLNNTGGLCALVGLTASLFCRPGEKRLREELYITKD